MRSVPIVVTAALAAILPTTAHGAALGVTPVKPCYRGGEEATVSAAGFTPNGAVSLSHRGFTVFLMRADDLGNAGGTLVFGRGSSTRPRSERYTATDRSNPAISATMRLKVVDLAVTMRPSSGDPARPRVIRASGFRSGRRLYAHVVRGRDRRTISVGRLRGGCRKLKARRQLFPQGAPRGRYRVQFDTRRRYSRGTPERVTFGVTVFRASRGAAAASARWTRLTSGGA
jgi:hypothetical protein